MAAIRTWEFFGCDDNGWRKFQEDDFFNGLRLAAGRLSVG